MEKDFVGEAPVEFIWLWLPKPFWYHFGIGAPILVDFSGDWDVHWGYGLLTHGHTTNIFSFGEHEGRQQVKSYA